MDNKEKEDLINKLLVFMNNDIERMGCTINQGQFNFNKDSEDSNNFMQKHPVNYDDLITILKICQSRNFIYNCLAGTTYRMIKLTEEGQGRAISYCNADEKFVKDAGNIHIGSINSNGAIQIGNYNVQNIENILTSIIDTINNSTASEEEKVEAKSLLNKFLSHPLVNTLLGSAASAATSLING